MSSNWFTFYAKFQVMSNTENEIEIKILYHQFKDGFITSTKPQFESSLHVLNFSGSSKTSSVVLIIQIILAS